VSNASVRSTVARAARGVTQRRQRTADASRPAQPVRVAGVVISHPERPIWPRDAITKADLARYYESVGPWLLPQLDRRPLSLVRCPNGVAGQCFFQRHMGAERPAGVKTFAWGRSSKDKGYLYIATLPAVIQLVQRGVVEFHTWGATMPRPRQPDRMTLDLDPDPALPWARLAEAAQLVRTLVEELGLKGFLKTTGGKGLHVVVPLERRYRWDEVRSVTRAMAEHLARTMPDRFTASMAKRRRTGRVFVDFLRNGEAATAVAAYSARARPDAPVSMPIGWHELAEDVRDGRFNIRTVPGLLSRRRADPWADYSRSACRLTRATSQALGA
jgi:bifunctional non-homologous end joining protein LigD